MSEIIITTKSDIAAVIIDVLDKRDAAQKAKENLNSLTINQVAKRLGRANATVKKMVINGVLASTLDGRIPETELERFLSGS